MELTDLAESTYFLPDRVSLSRDGTRMAFTERLRDVYLRDFSAGTKEQLDVADGGRPMNRSGHAAISADGAKVAFGTRKAGANPGDDRGTDVFITDIRTSDLVTASTTTDGGVLTADADYPSLSADGGLAAFSANGKVYLKTLLRAVPVGIGDASAVESDEPMTLLPVVVSLGAASPVPVTVLVRTGDQTAIAGVDYLAGERELVFAPGQTTRLVFMHIYGDDVAEPTETFTLDLLFTSLAWLADSQAIVTITDDD